MEYGVWGLLEPVMSVEVTAPSEFMGAVQATLVQRQAIVLGTDSTEGFFSIFCEVSCV